MKCDIKSIWSGVLKNNSNSWQILVKMYTPLVLSVARRAGLRQTDAEDCAQLTWFTLYKSRLKIKKPEKIPNWLTRVTVRKVNHILKNKYQDGQTTSEVYQENHISLPDEELLNLERDLQLELAIEKLEPQCQRILRAFFYSHDDKSYKDVARELRIPQNSLGPTRIRCLRKLKKILIKSGYPWIT